MSTAGQRRRDAQVLAPERRREDDPREQEARERHRGEERVRRVHERERDRRGRDREHLTAPSARDEREDEREQRGGDQRPGDRRRQREEVERPRSRAGEADQPDLGGRRRDARSVRAEERGAGCVGEHDRQRREDRRQVQHDDGRVDVGEPRDHRQPRVPHGERVARMEAAVAELVDDVERGQVERLELPHAAEVEERVAVDRVRRPPDGAREQRRRGGHSGDRQPLALLRGNRRPQQRRDERHGREGGDEPERRRDRPAEGERERERSGQRGQAPGERRRDRDAECVRTAERAHEDPHPGRSARTPTLRSSRRMSPSPCAGRARPSTSAAGAASTSARKSAEEPSRPAPHAVDPHRLGHDSHARASSARAPAWRHAPPRARTSLHQAAVEDVPTGQERRVVLLRVPQDREAASVLLGPVEQGAEPRAGLRRR